MVASDVVNRAREKSHTSTASVRDLSRNRREPCEAAEYCSIDSSTLSHVLVDAEEAQGLRVSNMYLFSLIVAPVGGAAVEEGSPSTLRHVKQRTTWNFSQHGKKGERVSP